MFSCEFCGISKNTFFTEHLWATVSRNESYLVIRNRKKKHPADGSTTEITQENCCENIRRIFMEIINNIVQSLKKQNHCLRKDFYKV